MAALSPSKCAPPKVADLDMNRLAADAADAPGGWPFAIGAAAIPACNP